MAASPLARAVSSSPLCASTLGRAYCARSPTAETDALKASEWGFESPRAHSFTHPQRGVEGMCNRCEPNEDGYVEWWGSGNAFYYEAEPDEQTLHSLNVRLHGLPLDLNIPYV